MAENPGASSDGHVPGPLPAASRWRWRPGATLSVLAAIAGMWLVVLNGFVIATTASVAVAGEATALAAGGLLIVLIAARATVRALQRRRSGQLDRDTTAVAPGAVADTENDPLGWVRRRRFGA